MIVVESPSGHERARAYAYQVVFEEFLGLPCRVVFGSRTDVQVSVEGDAGAGPSRRTLRVADIFFGRRATAWLAPASLPVRPLARWNLTSIPWLADVSRTPLPVLYGNSREPSEPSEPSEPRIEESGGSLTLGLDVFGGVFFMLSRYEEAGPAAERDHHGRFPFRAALASREGFADRPIVNEYVEVLGRCLRRLWPGLPAKERTFRVVLSHDVDAPYMYAFLRRRAVARLAVGDAVRRRAPRRALHHIQAWRGVRRGDFTRDPYDTFDWLMDRSERLGVQSAFYFITSGETGYSVDHPTMRALLGRIHRRGHEIGLHAGYETYLDATETKRQFHHLLTACEGAGVRQDVWGTRQHVLRWRTPNTFANLDAAGLDYDTTLAFAEHTGFRSGTCFEHPTFDVVAERPLRLRERPLVVMDATVSEPRYMDLGFGDAAFDAIARCRDACRAFGGDFTLLWHNSRAVEPAERALYERVLFH